MTQQMLRDLSGLKGCKRTYAC